MIFPHDWGEEGLKSRIIRSACPIFLIRPLPLQQQRNWRCWMWVLCSFCSLPRCLFSLWRRLDPYPSRPPQTARFRDAWWAAETPVGSPTRLWFWPTGRRGGASLCGREPPSDSRDRRLGLQAPGSSAQRTRRVRRVSREFCRWRKETRMMNRCFPSDHKWLSNQTECCWLVNTLAVLLGPIYPRDREI